MKIDSNNLPVMEMFYSLQGEGYHSGSAAFFIRIAGCNVGCHWCDVKESWDYGNHDILNITRIIDSIDNKYGLYKIRLGSQDQKRIWKMKRQKLSRNYTTEIDDILIVR